MTNVSKYSSMAANDFRNARRRAILEDVARRLTGKPADLLAYDEVRKKLRAHLRANRVVKDIPLSAIVGSVGRYTDFTRSFLPRRDSDGIRWTRVQQAMTSMRGVPPIEVYQIGEAFFVLDGNHRVSVARQLGETAIEAYVTELHTRVRFGPNDSPDDLIIKAEYADFLEHTLLDELRPGANLETTAPGHYPALEEQIELERARLAVEPNGAVSIPEAAAHWYDHVYLPVIHNIRERGALRDFPLRTETDLYIWVSEQRDAIAQELGWQIGLDPAIASVISKQRPEEQPGAARLRRNVVERLTPSALVPGPNPGEWRDLVEHRRTHLFGDIVVPLSGEPDGWFALEQAIILAQREEGRVHGLHIVATSAQQTSASAQHVREEFNWRCTVAGVMGNLVIEVGNIATLICERARLADMLVLNVAHPPSDEPLTRLKSGLRTIIQRCPCPILAVPQNLSYCQQVLLCYDGSRKAEEALFVASYLALQWQAHVLVVSVEDWRHDAGELLAHTRQYLEAHGVRAEYQIERGQVPTALMRAATSHKSELIIMGGYGAQPMLEMMVGSTVDYILRASQWPTLICR